MAQAKFYTGSIDFSKLLEEAKKGNKAFTKSIKNGKIYLNIGIWVNEEPNEHGQHLSLTGSFKEDNGAINKFYFGNAKEYVSPKPEQPSTNEFPEEDDLPF